MRTANFVRVNFTLPKTIYVIFKSLVPERKRSSVVTSLIKNEVGRLEMDLHKAAVAVEKDRALNKEMRQWDSTLTDGLEDAPWR